MSGLDAQRVADLALVAGNASVARHLDGTAIDAGGLVPDVVDTNTWVQTIDQISRSSSSRPSCATTPPRSS